MKEQMEAINKMLANEDISSEDRIKLLNSKIGMMENGTPSGDKEPDHEGKTGAELIKEGLKKYKLGGGGEND